MELLYHLSYNGILPALALGGMLEELDLPEPLDRLLLGGVGPEASAGRLRHDHPFPADFLDHTVGAVGFEPT